MTETQQYGFPLPSDASRISALPWHMRRLSQTLEDKLPGALSSAAQKYLPGLVDAASVKIKQIASEARSLAATATGIASAAASSVQSTMDRLDSLESAAGWGPSTPEDGTVSAYLSAAGSLSRAVLESDYRRGVSVREYGALGDDTADDTAAIQAAADAAHAAGEQLYFPAGKYRTTGTIILRGPVSGGPGTIRYHGTGTALIVGSPGHKEPAWRTTYVLPRVEHRTTAWDGTSIGVRAVNLNACTLVVPYVREFERGLLLEGHGTGFAYTTLMLGTLWCNHVQLDMTADNAGGGYCNQNTIVGGRLQLPSTYLTTPNDPAAHQLRMLSDDPTWGPNSNVFIGTSFETDAAPLYALDVAGPYNQFIGCRWEGFGKPFRIRWRQGANRNIVDGGYDLWKIKQIYEGPDKNTVRDDLGSYASLQQTGGPSIPSGVRTVVRYWESEAARLITHKRAEGKIRPARGRWRVTAQLTYTASPAGRRQAFLVWQSDTSPGPSTLAAAEAPAGTATGARTSVLVTGTHDFDGATDVWVEALQDSGASLKLDTSVKLNTFALEYVGP